MKTLETDYGVNFTVRLPNDLAAFVETMAKESCNSCAGILRLAVTKLRQTTEQPAAESPSLESSSKEMELAAHS